MLNIVLLSHGHLASGMKNTIELIAGRQDNLFTYDAYVDGNSDIKAFLLDFLKIHLNEKVIVITDFLGGSVNNDAIECKNNYDFYLITGMNVLLVLNLVLKYCNSELDSVIRESIQESQKMILSLDHSYEIENEEGTVKYKAFLIACGNASQYGNNAYIAPQASLTDGLMDVTILEPFTVLDVPSLSFQLFNKTIDQNSRIKTFRTKKIKIHRSKPGVMHYDGDPIMGGKDIEVELIPHGLNIIVSDKKKENEPFSLLQQISEIFSGMKPKAETFAFRHSHLFELNKSLLRRLSKKQ